MKIFTQEILEKLAANGRATRLEQEANRNEPDHKPVVKVFCPWSAATWLFTESDPDEPDTLFGLCYIHEVELGYASRSEIEQTIIRGLNLERDISFRGDYPLSVYTKAAREAGRITEDKAALDRAEQEVKNGLD